ncbi:uncharacterized protein At4g15970-like isoform X3 [Phragmites australis]|uniref:uncharacterized protein At4g15970-like isoform X3 n=1 Tax=Phragmites australis TaxID=29695 RepID=UPI002D78224C|nr:uncharacterized protein At4g15970-like isoform X3 [Phragmites australis]
MARPARQSLMSAPSTKRPRGHPRHALGRAAAALFLATLVALPFAVLYRAAVGRSLQDSWGWDSLPSVEASEEEGSEGDDLDSEDLKLERVLNKASMEDNTVILTTLNAAWASPGSVIDLFIDSFHSGVRTSSLLKHLVIVTFDWKAYEQCAKIHPYCFALGTEGVDFSDEKRFLTSGYLDMMWKRLDFLRSVLEKGYNFIFSDADIMWFRNPFPHFYPEADFQIACDHYVGNATDLRNIDIGLKIKFLSTTYFGGFCEPSRDINKVCTMHANCCIGLRSKIHDLRIMMDDWRSYLSLPPNLKRLQTLAWRVPQNCRFSMVSRITHRINLDRCLVSIDANAIALT